MMPSEVPLHQEVTNSVKLNRSGSGDALLLLTRRRAPRRNRSALSQDSPCSSRTGNHATSSSHSDMSSFLHRQARLVTQTNLRSESASISPVPASPRNSHRNLQLRRTLGLSSPDRDPFPRSPKSSDYANLKSHVSAPALFRQQQRMKTSTSGDNVSTASASSHGSTNSMNFKGNVAMQVAQRSNGSTVKSVIAQLHDIVANATENGEFDTEDEMLTNNVDLPLAANQEMALLSQWASADVYYKVVITKYQGIPTIIKIMQLYAEDPEIQVYGMITLSHLTNKQQIYESGGVQVCINALRRFSSSIEVQSQGFGMLKSQAMLLMQEPHDRIRSLASLLALAKDMYLTKTGRDGVAFVQRFLETYALTKVEEASTVRRSQA